MGKTPKAVALGSALRQARQDRGLKLRDFAVHISRDPAMLSRWENGERCPKPEQVARILASLGVSGERYDEVMTLVHGTSEPHWVATTLPEQRQQMAAYIACEKAATSIVEVAPLLIPGILQTSEYTTTIMEHGGVPAVDIPARVAGRAARREVLTRWQPATLLALIGEGALAHRIGGPSVMAKQLGHLLELVRLPNVDIRVVPFGDAWHPGYEGSFALMESEHTMPSVFVGTRRTALWLHQPEDVREYQEAVSKVAEVALNAVDSLHYISSRAKRLGAHDVA